MGYTCQTKCKQTCNREVKLKIKYCKMEMKLASERPMGRTMVPSQGGQKPRLVTPGEVISEDTSFMRGHGTYMEEDIQVASVAGYVTRVNRLITVTPLRQVYQGSVVDTILSITNIHLPGGEQRRKGLEDERSMRSLLKEGDLVCVEVQKITDDGLLRLAARSSKFGKLSQGALVAVSPSLIVLDKQRIHDLPCGARVIFGANGYVFVTPTTPQEQASSYTTNTEEVPLDIRKTIVRLYSCIRLLSHHSIMISPTSVMAAHDQSIESDLEIKDLLRPEVMQDIAMATVQVTIS